MPHEILGRTPPDLEPVLDDVSEKTLPAFAELGGAWGLFGNVLLQVLHELLGCVRDVSVTCGTEPRFERQLAWSGSNYGR
jgi:hypothetical protein